MEVWWLETEVGTKCVQGSVGNNALSSVVGFGTETASVCDAAIILLWVQPIEETRM
jgi:hypothetical protein